MASINFATREINCKIVYYGPGLSGKTTNLQIVHQKLPPDKKSEMVSLDTEQDRTIFFDFLPLDLGSIKGFKTKFQLYTVPGQVYYNSTRKLVLRGVDGVVFVADSQENRMKENLESLQNLEENLAEYGLKLADLPFVLQYNKRDLPGALEIPALEEALNKYNVEHTEATAHNGMGVIPTLKLAAKKVIEKFNSKGSGASKPKAAKPAAPKPAPAPTPVTPPPQTQPKANDDDDDEDDLVPYSQPKSAAPPPPAPAPPSFDDDDDDDDDFDDEEDVELRPYIPRK
jgi:signal recognition particle receptor subunit beta